MEWNEMDWNGVHGMIWNEIFCSKLMLDPPKQEPRGLQNQSRRPPGALKFAFGSTWSSKLACHGPFGQPLGRSEGPSGRSWASIWISGDSFVGPMGRFGCPGHPFGDSRGTPRQHFVNFTAHLQNSRKPLKNVGFPMVFQ